MPMLEEKEIRAYQIRNGTLVCPLCSTDQEGAADDTVKIAAEDVIHDSGPLECVRCNKRI